MVRVVGVKFDESCRIYLFNALHFELKKDDHVIVDTQRGQEMGIVAKEPYDMDENAFELDLKSVIRKASEKDLRYYAQNQKLAAEAFKLFKEKLKDFDLDMKPLYAEYSMDRTKIVFYYAANERIDFRDLLKVINPLFKSRVELRQISAREGARVIGGLGPCGMEICCKRHLTNFINVTMKMAKEQDMSLNSSKITGTCGKLLCCIAFENELYKELKQQFPKVGTFVSTPNCEKCKIESIDYLKKLIKVREKQDGLLVSYQPSDIKLLEPVVPEVIEEEVIEEVVVNEEKEIKKMTAKKLPKYMRKKRKAKY